MSFLRLILLILAVILPIIIHRSIIKKLKIKSEGNEGEVKNLTDLLINKSEKIIDSLGVGFLDNVFRNEKSFKSVLFFSNMRLYHKGGAKEKWLGRSAFKSIGDKVINLKDIRYTRVVPKKNWWFFSISIIAFMLSVLFYSLPLFLYISDNDAYKGFGLVYSLVFLLFILLFFFKKNKYLIVGFESKELRFKTNYYFERSTDRFMRNLHAEIEKARKK